MAVRVVTATVVHSLMFPAYLHLLLSVTLTSLFTIREKPRVQPRYRLDWEMRMVPLTALRRVQRPHPPRLHLRPRPRPHLRPNLFQGKKRLH